MNQVFERLSGRHEYHKAQIADLASWRRRYLPRYFCGLFFVTFLGSCSLLIDVDNAQCKSSSDCVQYFGESSIYQCEDGVCVRPSCKSSKSCQDRGGRFAYSFCGSDNRCQIEECKETKDCSGDRICNTAEKRCIEPECTPDTVAVDCESESPTIECVDGKCADDTWGCIGKVDTRTAQLDSATLKTKLNDPFSGMPPTGGVTVRSCINRFIDPQCNSAIPGSTNQYDESTGEITVSGIPQGSNIRLAVEPLTSDYQPVDVYIVKPMVDVTTLEPIVIMPESVLQQSLVLSEATVTLQEGLTRCGIQVYSCDDKAAAGVTIEVAESDRLPDTSVVYVEKNFFPILEATATSSSGLTGIVNLRVEELVGFQFKLGTIELPKFEALFEPGRTIYVAYFPYDTQTDTSSSSVSAQ